MRRYLVSLALSAALAGGCDVPVDEASNPAPPGTEIVRLEQVIGDSSAGGSSGPGGAIIAGTKYLTFVSPSKQAYILKHLGGPNWQKNQVLNEHTSGGVALSHWEGWFVVVMPGLDSRDLVMRRSVDGVTWRYEDVVVTRLECDPGQCGYIGDPALFVTGNVLHALAPYRGSQGTPSGAHLHLLHVSSLGISRAGFVDEMNSPFPSVTRADAPLSVHADWSIHWFSGGQLHIKRYLHPSGWTVPISRPWNGRPHVVKTADGYLMASSSMANIGPDQISFYTSPDGARWTWRANSVHTTRRRPFVLSATNNWVEFSHVGTDSQSLVNINSQSF